jgi:NTE family protein
LEDVLAATRRASARPVESLDTRTGFEGVVDQLDDILARNAMVVVVGRAEGRTAPLLLQYVDRAVILVEEEREAQRFATSAKESSRGALPLGLGRERVEVVLVGKQGGSSMSRTVGDLPVVRTLSRSTGDGGEPIDATDVAWLGRHLSRTKIGLALGAGGAKGYAHVGVLQVLEEAGYTVDFVAGSSIGAIIGCYLALGMSAEEIDRTLRAAFEPETVAEVFKLSMAGTSTGRETMARIFKETTQERSFDQTQIPLTVMSVDLAERAPAPIQDGPLWRALLAATALAGMFPPYEREGQRLVDGLALVPVPTGSVRDCGADLAVSVNLVSRELLSAWPGEEPPPAPPPRRRGSRMLDTLLEVMDVMQLDTSVRHAELADVVVSPRFGPGSWRDFHLADMFLRAGRQAMEERLPELGSLARPQSVNVPK